MSSLRDVPEHVLREITNFFEVRKRERDRDKRDGNVPSTVLASHNVPLCTSCAASGVILCVRGKIEFNPSRGKGLRIV